MTYQDLKESLSEMAYFGHRGFFLMSRSNHRPLQWKQIVGLLKQLIDKVRVEGQAFIEE